MGNRQLLGGAALAFLGRGQRLGVNLPIAFDLGQTGPQILCPARQDLELSLLLGELGLGCLDSLDVLGVAAAELRAAFGGLSQPGPPLGGLRLDREQRLLGQVQPRGLEPDAPARARPARAEP